jgi:hypothetical protein
MKYLALLLLTASALATTRNAATCAVADVQTQVTASVDGDIVNVPACGSTTWSSSLSVTKAIKLQGQTTCSGTPTTSCLDNTNIVDNTSGNAINVSGITAGKFVEVTGFSISSQTSKSNGMVSFTCSVGAPNAFRYHDTHIIIATGAARGTETLGCYGLIDHILFSVTNTSSIQSVSPTGSSDSTNGGFTPWMSPSTLGTESAVFVEDSTFNYCATCTAEDSIDGYGGARIVVRHNAFNNAHIGFHGFDSGNRRSPVSIEVYNNAFTNNTATTYRAGTVRGGTGVWHDNTFGGSHGAWNGVTLMLYRACGLGSSGWGNCDGTDWVIGSKDFSSNASRTAHAYTGVFNATNVGFCAVRRDTVCSSGADCLGGPDTCSTFEDGAGSPSSGACRDQPGRGHDQVLEPIYAWSNTGGITIGTYDGGSGCAVSTFISSGRDYVNNGSTPKPGYAAFTYPHPLQGGAPPPPPAPSYISGVTITGVVVK